ncbi:MAG: c-type cytochrome [Paracoccaceae bacterium]
MNSHKVNMYVGTIIGSLLFFLLLGFFSELIYVGRGHSEHDPLAFAIEVEEEAAETAEAEEDTVDFAALVAAADPAAGEKLFSKCKACHKVEDGANGVGPFLWGVVGRPIGSVAGFKYSDSLANHGGDWSLENLLGFLEAPKTWAPGTKMAFKGMPKIEDRINLIVYLNEADGSPIELAEGAATGSVVAAAAEAATETVVETVVETETVAAVTEGAAEAAAPGGGSFGELLTAARIDVEAGKRIFRKCQACHKVEEGKNGVGPSLWGVVGRDIASVEGFKYSEAMKGQEGNWTGARLFAYLENPGAVVPGTKMKFPGLKDAQDRINVIIFLNEVDGSPEPLE